MELLKTISKAMIIVVFLITTAVRMNGQNFRIQAPPGYNYIYTEDNLPKGTEGSPYLEDWKGADILLKNGKTISGLKVLYNVYLNQMLYQYDNKTYIIGAPDSIAELKFPARKFIYQVNTEGENKEKDYFEVAVKGKVSFLIKYKVLVIRPNYNVALAIGNKNSKMEIREEMYLQRGVEMALINKKTKLLSFLSDKNKEVSAYIDQEGLSIKNKEDMIKIVNYYNQL